MDSEPESDRVSVASFLDRAAALIDLGRYDQALAELSQAVASEPDNSYLRCRLAETYSRLNRNEEALEHARTALSLDPNNDWAHFQIAVSLRSLKHFDAALEHIRTAVRIDPENGASLYMLALCEYQCGHYRDALDSARRAVNFDPDNGALHGLLGDLVFNIETSEKAEPHYREALRLDPGDADRHADLAFCLAASGRAFEAAESYLRAVRIDPSDEVIRTRLFNVLHHDLMNAPKDVLAQITDQFDPVLQQFYVDYASRRNWLGKLTMVSMFALCAGALLVFTLVIALATGEDIGPILNLALLLLAVGMGLKLVLWSIKRRKIGRWRKAQAVVK